MPEVRDRGDQGHAGDAVAGAKGHPQHLHPAARGIAAQHDRTLCLTPPDPLAAAPAAGTGAIAPQACALTACEPLSSAFQQAVASGRAGRYALAAGGNLVLTVFVVYGFTGGHDNTQLAAPTDAL